MRLSVNERDGVPLGQAAFRRRLLQTSGIDGPGGAHLGRSNQGLYLGRSARPVTVVQQRCRHRRCHHLTRQPRSVVAFSMIST